MTTGKRLTEFGQRRPTPLPPAPGPKRSSHVALLVMGTIAVGGGAYALIPRENCTPPAPPAPGMAAPAVPQASTACAARSSSSTGGGSGGSRSWSRLSFFGGDSSSHSSSTSGTESSSGVSRGGFGSFAHAFGFGGG
jgi:hypothetical protein